MYINLHDAKPPKVAANASKDVAIKPVTAQPPCGNELYIYNVFVAVVCGNNRKDDA
jgi:hypothetical protein